MMEQSSEDEIIVAVEGLATVLINSKRENIVRFEGYFENVVPMYPDHTFR